MPGLKSSLNEVHLKIHHALKETSYLTDRGSITGSGDLATTIGNFRQLEPPGAWSPEHGWQMRIVQRSDSARRRAARWSRPSGRGQSGPPKTYWVTMPASPAARAELGGEHQMVAGLDSLHRLADPFHHTSAFVAKHDRAGSAAIAEINVGMADSTGHHAHQYLVIARVFHFQALDLQSAARRPQHNGPDGRGRLPNLWAQRCLRQPPQSKMPWGHNFRTFSDAGQRA